MKQEDEFLMVLERNKGILFKIANSYCKNEEDREDLVQEMILQLWRSFGNYDSRFKYSTWIYRIALNVAISFYRKEKTVVRSSAISIEDTVLVIQDTGFKEDKECRLKLLHQFIAGLKALDRALMLLYFEEKSYQEIASIMGITETNVATKIGRIKKKLKQKFTSEEI